MEAARALYDNFIDFIRAVEPSDPNDLFECILEWLENGEAVVESGGNFGTYMTGVVVIIARWLEDPSILHHQPEARTAPTAALTLDTEGTPFALDRDYFRAVLFRRLTSRC